MNYFSQQIISAIETITEDKISKLKYDKTVQAEIDSIVDLTTGEYRVRYEGNIFSAFAQSKDDTFKKGEKIFLMIPEGDLSNKKIIQGKSEKRDLESFEQEKLKYSYVPVGPSFEFFFPILKEDGSLSEQIYGLIAGGEQQPGIDEKTKKERLNNKIIDVSQSQSNDLFNRYQNKYKTFLIQAEIKTQFFQKMVKGNYGIKISFYPLEDGKEDIEYSFDISKFNGNPYAFNNYNTQKAILTIPSRGIKSLKSIEVFQESFDPDYNGTETNQILLFNPNIFIKNIQMQFVEQIDLSQFPFYLQIKTPRGILLKSGDTAGLELVGNLIHKNQSILDNKSCECFWYQRNFEVQPGHPNYDKTAGATWELIPQNNGDKEKINFNILKVTPNCFNYTKEYKLVVIYKEKTVITQTIEVFNLSKEKVEILFNKNKELFLSPKEKNITGIWYGKFPDGSYRKLYEDAKNSISIADYMDNPIFTFFCKTNNDSLTYQYIKLDNKNINSLTAIFEGNTVYKYDANGDIRLEQSQLSQSLIYLLNKKDFQHTSEWQVNNIKITTEPQNIGMLQNVYTTIGVDGNQKLCYNIRQKYLKDNQIKVKLKIIDSLTDEEFFFQKEFLFIKDGDTGTNGTDYYVIIKPIDSNNNIDEKYQCLCKDDQVIKLKAFLYKNGEQITPDSANFDGEEISYKWTKGTNISFFNNSSETEINEVLENSCGILKKAGFIKNDYNQNYVKLEVNISKKAKIINKSGQKTEQDTTTDLPLKNFETKLISYYPVNIFIGTLNNLSIESNISSYIKFDPHGLNPYYNRDYFSFIVNNKEISTFEIAGGKTSEFIPFDLYTNNESGKTRLSVSRKYLNDDKNFYAIKILIDNNNYILHTLFFYLNQYGNNNINDWDGTKLKIGADETYLLAPQIGAGSKSRDNENLFTGVLMGEILEDGKKKNGLFGYSNGINTFSFNAKDGSATLGAPDAGQIIINGTNGGQGIIESAGFSSGNMGMKIDLKNGFLKLRGATVNEKIELNSKKEGDNNPLTIGSNFEVDWDGNITATGGQIGDWYIDKGLTNAQDSTNATIGLNPSAIGTNPVFWAGGKPSEATFKVDRNGNVILNGTITWSKIDDIETDIADITTKVGNENVNGSILNQLKAHGIKLTGADQTQINRTAIYSPNIFGGQLVAIDSEKNPLNFLEMTSNGIVLKGCESRQGEPLIGKNLIEIGYVDDKTTGSWDTPFILLGQGNTDSTHIHPNSARIQKYGRGLWIGNNAVDQWNGNLPFTTANTIGVKNAVAGTGFGTTFSTGFWFDFVDQRIICHGKNFNSFEFGDFKAVFA